MIHADKPLLPHNPVRDQQQPCSREWNSAAYHRLSGPQVSWGKKVRFADGMNRGIRDSELLIFEGYAHAPLYEKVEEFNQQTLVPAAPQKSGRRIKRGSKSQFRTVARQLTKTAITLKIPLTELDER